MIDQAGGCHLCDATRRRVYGERNEMKKRGRRAARSGAEEVVEGHFGLDDAGMLVALHAVGRDKGDMAVPCLRIIGLEGRDLVAERLRVIGLNHKLRFRELHLAEIGHAVAATDDEIDLRPRIVRSVTAMPPGGQFGLDAGYPQRFLDLVGVLETNHFKRKSLPCHTVAIIQEMHPMIAIMSLVITDELKIEQRVVVNQLED